MSQFESSQGRRIFSERVWGSLILFCSDLQLTGLRPHTIGRATCFTKSTNITHLYRNNQIALDPISGHPVAQSR